MIGVLYSNETLSSSCSRAPACRFAAWTWTKTMMMDTWRCVSTTTRRCSTRPRCTQCSRTRAGLRLGEPRMKLPKDLRSVTPLNLETCSFWRRERIFAFEARIVARELTNRFRSRRRHRTMDTSIHSNCCIGRRERIPVVDSKPVVDGKPGRDSSSRPGPRKLAGQRPAPERSRRGGLGGERGHVHRKRQRDPRKK